MVVVSSAMFVITKPSAEKKPGRRQDCVDAASVAGIVSRIGQGENHGLHEWRSGQVRCRVPKPPLGCQKSLQALWSRPNGPIPRRQIHTHLHREGTGLIWYVKQSCTKRFMREAPFERETNRALVNVGNAGTSGRVRLRWHGTSWAGSSRCRP